MIVGKKPLEVVRSLFVVTGFSQPGFGSRYLCQFGPLASESRFQAFGLRVLDFGPSAAGSGL